ncbi:MAG: hypothetical protein HC903_04725 [Methylacidiphilales bacterium]|nr:hypothetical protein [Candidatus Methylacidiphilales bacterium]
MRSLLPGGWRNDVPLPCGNLCEERGSKLRATLREGVPLRGSKLRAACRFATQRLPRSVSVAALFTEGVPEG